MLRRFRAQQSSPFESVYFDRTRPISLLKMFLGEQKIQESRHGMTYRNNLLSHK